ncbi:MAG TPA: polysaccharide biosynthesis protein [Nocardioidaceae bacterium]|nr:polysaccharide biosynthesis protein [Nocardioidaceae bacterium]
MLQPPSDLRSRLAGAGLVAVAITGMNVATYGFTLVAAHLLAPAHFGELTAMMGIILVGNVAALGLQATTARRIATRNTAGERAAVIEAARRATWIAAGGVAVVTLALSPLLQNVLDLTSSTSMVLVALTLIPLTIIGAQAGVAQGNRRWGRLAVLYAAVGAGRLVFGTAAAAIDAVPSVVMAGVLVGAVVPVVVGWPLLRTSPSPSADSEAPLPYDSRAVLVEAMHGTHALLAYFALTNADALLARIVLSPHDSGVYAAGLIVTKACLFLPQFVTVVAFPDLAQARDTRTRRIAALLIAMLGAGVIVGTWLLPDLALAFVGGSEYSDVRDLLPLFALEGSVFALLQLLLYDSLARRDLLITVALWTALAAAIVVVLTSVDTVAMLPVVMTVAAGCVALLSVVPIRRRLPVRQ